MTRKPGTQEDRKANWRPAAATECLSRDGKALAKIDGKQIALFATEAGIFACNNRCPHEGYPLREGTIDGACVLTCNWHNWKFDLRDGTNLYGGDRLRVYPTRVADGTVWVDIADPSAAERQAEAYGHLRAAFDDDDYDRMARELARLIKAGGDPVEAVAAAVDWSHDRLEYGMTHAYAAASGWLMIYDASGDPEQRLACLLEAIGYMSWEVLREPLHAYPTEARAWDPAAFRAAIEATDEAAAIGHLRGALAEGRRFPELEPALTEAALSHYADFGHSLIYVVHAGHLIDRLGGAVTAPVLLTLVRSLVYARREDLIPEFRGYAAMLASWPQGPMAPSSGTPPLDGISGRSAEGAMAVVRDAAAHATPQGLYVALLGAASLNLLQFDIDWQAKTDGSIAQNVGWLDFTHGVTFANAVRRQCTRFPALWPAGLLQLACFVGRNTGFTTSVDHRATWRVTDRRAYAASVIARLADHGEDRYILAAHLLKTFLAAMEEVDAGLPPDVETIVLAAVNRFLNAPLKRKHVRRTAHQAMDFVALED
jgi:nitrite reductase/ring-hydroxylating ferredoxin subunit